MLNLRDSRFCLVVCLLACASAVVSAPPAQSPKPAAVAFSRAIQREDVGSVAKCLKANPGLANAPLVFGDGPVGSQTHSPLSLTAFEGNTQIALLLIQAGANVNAVDQQGKTALDEAVTFSNPQMVTLLLAYGANIAYKDTAGLTALHEAVEGDDPGMVALLLKHGANVNAQDVAGETPLALLHNPHIQGRNHPAILALLRQHGAKG